MSSIKLHKNVKGARILNHTNRDNTTLKCIVTECPCLLKYFPILAPLLNMEFELEVRDLFLSRYELLYCKQ